MKVKKIKTSFDAFTKDSFDKDKFIKIMKDKKREKSRVTCRCD